MAIDIWEGTAGDHNWANGANWLTGVPSKTTDVLVQTGTPAVVASASIGTVNSIINSNPSGLSFESAGTTTTDKVTTFLNNTGALFVDGIAGDGGTTLNIGGALTNGTSLTSATFTIGNTTLSAKTTVTAASLSNGTRGTINVTGSSTNQALLDVTGAAGFGTAGVLTGAVFVGNQFTPNANDKSAIEFGSGQITSLANGAGLHLFGNQAFIEDSGVGNVGKNSALSGLASIGSSATFQLESQVTVSTTGALANNRGTIVLDQNFGDGGSSLKVAGALSNTGTLDLGNSSLSSADSITASSLVNSSTGTITLAGSASTQALLNITGAAGFGAAGTLTGTVSLSGDSAIEFASGQIARIASGATLFLSGNSAFIEDSSALGSDSALKGLSNVAGGLEIDSNVSLTTTGALLDTGTVNLDTAGGSGGLTLSLGGALSIGGTLSVGNTALSSSCKVITTALNLAGASPAITLTGAGSNQALIDVTGGVAGFGVGGVLTGTVSLLGNTAIEFKSGTISSIAGSLTLNGINSGINGNNALIEDSTGLGSNSALNFASVSGALSILNGESVSVIKTTGNPTGSVNNSGSIAVDSSGGHGSSSLKIAGRLTNLGTFVVGNQSLTSAVQATVGALANVGTITVAGATSTPTPALLDVTGAAGFGTAGIVSGSVSLSGDSAIEFASGEITSVGLGALLHLNGSKAFIEDSTALNSNSALQGLSNVVGTFSLDNLGSVSTTGALINDGLLELDIDGSSGSSTLSVKTGLTNNGTLKIGNGSLSGSDTMTAATLSNTGTILLNGAGSNQALLDVTAAAGFGTAGTLTGSATLTQDSAIEFASGQINTIGAGSQLTLNGNNAFIEDSKSLNSNSALTGLTTVAGSFNLDNGAAVSTTGAVVDSGLLSLDFNVFGAGGSTLAIAGAGGLTNTGTLDIGNSGLASSDSVTVKTFTNSGTVNLTGNSSVNTDVAALNVSGATTNNGSIVITNDTEALAGAVSGAGSFSLSTPFGSTTTLQFGSSVSAGQTINETGLDSLILKHAESFAATISGFGNNSGSTFLDTIDAANFLFSGTSLKFVENSANTGGTLTLTDGSLVAKILMAGSYSNSSFSLGHDSGTGTLVTFV